MGPRPPEGARDTRRYWAPKMVYEGEVVFDLKFEAWKTRWPRDCTEMSGKTITAYLPEEGQRKYPAYFPYWLEIQGMLGKAKVRIIDSGKGLRSPRPAPPRRVG